MKVIWEKIVYIFGQNLFISSLAKFCIFNILKLTVLHGQIGHAISKKLVAYFLRCDGHANPQIINYFIEYEYPYKISLFLTVLIFKKSVYVKNHF